GPNEGKSDPGTRAHGRFRARKSRADHSRRTRPRNRHRPDDPLRRSQRTETRNRGGIAVGQLQLERSFAAVSLAAIQIGQETICEIGRCCSRCDERWRQTAKKNGRGTLRKADAQTLESLDALKRVCSALAIRFKNGDGTPSSRSARARWLRRPGYNAFASAFNVHHQ